MGLVFLSDANEAKVMSRRRTASVLLDKAVHCRPAWGRVVWVRSFLSHCTLSLRESAYSRGDPRVKKRKRKRKPNGTAHPIGIHSGSLEQNVSYMSVNYSSLPWCYFFNLLLFIYFLLTVWLNVIQELTGREVHAFRRARDTTIIIYYCNTNTVRILSFQLHT